jgi:hypothetical protein
MANINLLFTCPHGGKNGNGSTENPPIIRRTTDNFPAENICPAQEGQGFNDVNDALTEDLTKAIADQIRNLSGKNPYVELAEFNRRWIDYNRKEEGGCAYVLSAIEPNSSAQNSYQKYHSGISQRIEEMLPQDEDNLAFLFDIHGTDQERDPNDHFIEVIIGTDQTRSRKALTDDYFWGDNGLKPLLDREKGIRAYPENLCRERESHPLDGGHTIKTYASSRLVAIQIEVIRCIRDNRYCRRKFAADIAECILNFAKPLGIF